MRLKLEISNPGTFDKVMPFLVPGNLPENYCMLEGIQNIEWVCEANKKPIAVLTITGVEVDAKNIPAKEDVGEGWEWYGFSHDGLFNSKLTKLNEAPQVSAELDIPEYVKIKTSVDSQASIDFIKNEAKTPTIYVVTSGSYSDYGIQGIFSTREKADRYISEYNKAHTYSDINNVEEYNLDELDNQFMRQYWTASINLLTGELKAPYYDWQNNDELKRLCNNNGRSEHRECNGVFYVDSFVSEEHAKKVCVEKYQEHLRCTTKSDTIQNGKQICVEEPPENKAGYKMLCSIFQQAKEMRDRDRNHD